MICYFTGGKRVKTETEKEAYTGTYPNCSFEKDRIKMTELSSEKVDESKSKINTKDRTKT